MEEHEDDRGPAAKDEEAPTVPYGPLSPVNPEDLPTACEEGQATASGTPTSPNYPDGSEDLDETPAPSMFRASGNQIEVTFPSGKVEYTTATGTFSLHYVIDMMAPGFPAPDFILSVNGMQAMVYDLLELPQPPQGKAPPL